MDCGANTKVRNYVDQTLLDEYSPINEFMIVDYILFFTGDVDVTPNVNEISDYKYVSKVELQEMFSNPSTLKFVT